MVSVRFAFIDRFYPSVGVSSILLEFPNLGYVSFLSMDLIDWILLIDSQADDNGVLPFFDDDIESNLSSFSSENMGLWVPQAPCPSLQYSQMGGSGLVGFKDSTKEAANMNMIKANNNYNRSMWNDVDAFTVPQISPPSVGSKRTRPF